MQKFTVESTKAGERTDVYIASKYSQFARSALGVLFNKDLVTVNGEIAKPGHKLRIGEKVQVNDAYLYSRPRKIDIPVIYEDDNVVVMDKPDGLLTHSKGNLNLEPTVASFMESKLNDDSLTGSRAGIVHRLDRATSGAIIAAKNAKTQSLLQKQFGNRKTKKIYHAIVEGTPKISAAIIDAPIERNPKKPQTFRVGQAGKAAQTQYEVVLEFSKNGKGYSLLKLSPTTGRTHQLRVHLQYIGHPIVGDVVYGTGAKHRMMLHASSLELTIPTSQRKVFVSPTPKEFEEFIS